MESKDTPTKVADYYQKALAKYGAVLNCTNAARPQQANDEKSERLTCGDDKPETEGMLFKSGRPGVEAKPDDFCTDLMRSDPAIIARC